MTRRRGDRPLELLAAPMLVAVVLDVLAIIFLCAHVFMVFPIEMFPAIGAPLSIRTALTLIVAGAGGLGALHAAFLAIGALRSRRPRRLLAAVPGLGVLLLGALTAGWVLRTPSMADFAEQAEREIAEGDTTVLDFMADWGAREARPIARALRDRGGDEGFYGAAVLYRLGDRSEENRRIILERVETLRTRKAPEDGDWLRAACSTLTRRPELGLMFVFWVRPPRGADFWRAWVDLEPEIRGAPRTPMPEESALFGERGVAEGRKSLLHWFRAFGYGVGNGDLRDRVESSPGAAAALALAYGRTEAYDDLMMAAELYRMLSEASDPPDGEMAAAYLEALHAIAVLYGESHDREGFLQAFDRVRERREVWRCLPDRRRVLRMRRELSR